MSLIEELIIFKLENLSEAEKLSDKTSELVDLAYDLGHGELALMIEDNYY